ncbi:MAG: potassium transporter TrkG [Desulfurococcaceae archaeon]
MVMIRGSSIIKSVSMLLCLLGLLALSVPIIDFLTGFEVCVPFLLLSFVLTPLGVVAYGVKVDAIFESISGFTGTGLTVLTGLDYLRPSLLFWRALMQWVGELGFVVFAMVFFPFFYRYGLLIYGIERPVRIEASMYRTARRLFEIYIMLTIIGALSLYYTGMNIFDALVHSMTGIATGGMSNYDANYEAIYRASPFTSIPLVLIMVLGATNFLLIDRLMRGEVSYIFNNEEFKTYVVLILLISTMSSASFIASNQHTAIQEALVSSVFNAISALTTTGFNIGPISNLPSATKLTLTFGMVVGGMTFATVGGIKVLRLLILLKKIKATSIMLVTAGKIDVTVKLSGKILEDSEIASALILVFLHLVAIFTGASVIKAFMHERDFVDIIFEATSAASCVGLSSGVTSPVAPLGVKVTLMALMVLGRLEYLPVLLLAGYVLGRKTIKLIK